MFLSLIFSILLYHVAQSQPLILLVINDSCWLLCNWILQLLLLASMTHWIPQLLLLILMKTYLNNIPFCHWCQPSKTKIDLCSKKLHLWLCLSASSAISSFVFFVTLPFDSNDKGILAMLLSLSLVSPFSLFLLLCPFVFWNKRITSLFYNSSAYYKLSMCSPWACASPFCSKYMKCCPYLHAPSDFI